MVATKEPKYKVIGTRPIRPDGSDKVTGRAQYGADVRLSGMLFGRVKRSPYAHARIKRIDTAKAEALPGVKAVITRADFPEPSEGSAGGGEGAPVSVKYLVDQMMTAEKALYQGHPVAAVCATDAHVAEDALDLIEIEYEELPAVIDVREAMSPAAPVIHESITTNSPLTDTPKGPSNIATHLQSTRGNVEKGFAEADVVIEREFTTSMYHQGYIEPHNATASWTMDGNLTVWTSTQGSFTARDDISEILQVPVSRINVIPMEIGGGFGGKIGVYLEPLAALLAKKAGRPVKMTMNRDEVLEATGPTSGTYNRIKLGAKRDGTIVAAQAYMAYEAGCYPGLLLGAGTGGVFAPYDIANQLIDGFEVIVNKPKVAAYRAPLVPSAEFASESVVNELAKELDIDPIELRLKNAASEGSERAGGQRFGKIGCVEVIEAVKNHPHYKAELKGENVGRGVALGFWGNAGMETSGSASVNSDGTVSLVLASVDIGGSRASLSMMLAETLGIPVDDVRPRVVDTQSVGFTMMTAGSRTTFAGGWASYELGMAIRKQMAERAAKIWECEASGVEYGDDGVIRGPGGKTFSFHDLAAKLGSTGGHIDVAVNVNRSSVGPAFAGHIVDLKVDKETGKVEVLRYTAVQDVGTAIHPSYVEGQVQGGVVQGLGMALSEEYYYDDHGRMVNASFLDYRLPTALDVPLIETVLVEVPNPGHPYGVRGVGEVPIVPPMAAVQAGIEDAIGLRLYESPMSPRVILEALLEAEAKKA